MKNIIKISCITLLLAACTAHEAAVIGAIPGRIVGIPLGMAITAADESIKTAGDIVKANPRYYQSNKVRYSKTVDTYQSRPSRKYNSHIDGDYHYYKAEVLIKTQGPAQIKSMQLLESRNVTDFWQ